MVHSDAQAMLLDRYERAVREPRLMMLYPPVSTGSPYTGTPDAQALWESAPGTGTLYVHIPFCPARCAFCPFYANVGTRADFEAYVDGVLAEAAMYDEAVDHIRFTSVYLGGGTPSVLPPQLLQRLLAGLARHLRIEAADVTIEVHPATVDRRGLHDLHAAGITRVSLGVQAFDPQVLQACGRGDTAESVLPALRAALETPFREVNVDLMYGLPGQSRAAWAADLRLAAELGVPGLTLYATVYLPAFRSRCESLGLEIPTTDERRAMYEMAYDYLCGAGYPQTHFGAGAFLRGNLNAHRRNVARGLPTLGLGTWAYSSSGPFAYHNAQPTEAWADDVAAGRLPIRQLLVVPAAERARKHVIEALLLAFLDKRSFRDACGMDLEAAFPAELAVLDQLGLAKISECELRLTRRGGHHLREIRYLFASEAVVASLESGSAGL